MTRKYFLKWGVIICLVVIFFVGMKICIAKWHTYQRISKVGESASLGGWAYTDKDGNLVRSFGDFHEGLRIKIKTVKNDHLLNKMEIRDIYGYEDMSGRMVIDYKFDHATFFSERLAAVELNGKWGYIDKEGGFVIPPSFEWGKDFSERLASVQLNDKWGYIDKKGKFVIEPFFELADDFSEGLASVKLNGKWGYIDKKGEFVILPQYYYTYAFLNGVARVWVGQNDEKMIHIDKTGTEVPSGFRSPH